MREQLAISVVPRQFCQLSSVNTAVCATVPQSTCRTHLSVREGARRLRTAAQLCDPVTSTTASTTSTRAAETQQG